MQETKEMQIWSLGWEYPLEEGMAIHFSFLAWRIPRTEETGGLWAIVHRVTKRWTRLKWLSILQGWFFILLMVSFVVNTHTHTHTLLFRFHLFSFISIALGDIQKNIAANYAKECTAYPVFHSDFRGIWSYI